MSELGERLRHTRESMGISLEQAANETRILQQSLAALEEGAFHRLPGDVATRGFIRNYAHYLSLSSEELIEVYRRERGASDRIRVMPVTNPPRKRAYVLPNFFYVFFITLAIVGVSYLALSAIGRVGNRPTQTIAANTVTVLPPTALPVPSSSTLATGPTPTLPGVQVPRSPVPLSPDGPAGLNVTTTTTSNSNAPIVIELTVPQVRGNEQSWVRIQSDGNVVYEGMMHAGEKRLFEAQRRISVRAGNPTDVLVAVNGLQQGSLGQVPGKPVNWSWPPN